MGPWNKAGELCVFKKSEESVTGRIVLIIKSFYLLLFFRHAMEDYLLEGNSKKWQHLIRLQTFVTCGLHRLLMIIFIISKCFYEVLKTER